MKLFLRAFAQILMVSANVAMISRQYHGLIFITSALISTAWLFNTRHIAHTASRLDWLIYVLGAGAGSEAGAWLGWWWS